MKELTWADFLLWLRLSFLVVWLGLCIWALLAFYTDGHAFQHGERTLLFALQMYALTFPIGMSTYIILYFITELFQITDYIFYLPVNPQYSSLVGWILFVILGYLQWFYILPWLIKFLVRNIRRRS